MANAPPAWSEMREASAVPTTLEAIASPSSTSNGHARLNMGGVRIVFLAAGMKVIGEVFPESPILYHVEALPLSPANNDIGLILFPF
jgi:hypothetical protein